MNNGILQMQLPNGRRKPLAIAELYDRVLGVTGVLLKYEVGKVDVLDIMILLYVMRLSLLLPSNRRYAAVEAYILVIYGKIWKSSLK